MCATRQSAGLQVVQARLLGEKKVQRQKQAREARAEKRAVMASKRREAKRAVCSSSVCVRAVWCAQVWGVCCVVCVQHAELRAGSAW